MIQLSHNLITPLTIGALLVVFGFFLRVRPRLKAKSRGVDTWYFLACVREYKKNHKIPIRLKNYLLDIDEQWYPPGFTIFLSIFPVKFLEKYQWLLGGLIDCLQLALVYILTFSWTGNLTAAVLAALVYASAPTLIAENSTLNSRGLGSLNFTLLLLIFFFYQQTGNLLILAVAFISSFFLLLTHKMAVQNWIFASLGFALIFWRIDFALFLAAGFLLAIALSGGFYIKVLKGHIEILRFWAKNLRNLGAHQIYDSEIYHNSGRSRKRLFPLFHQSGFKGIVKHLKHIFGHNPWVVFLPVVFLFAPVYEFNFWPFLFWWTILTYLFVFLTTFVSPLRFLGEGYKYIKLSIFPLAYMTGVMSAASPVLPYLFMVIFGLCVFLSVKFVGRQTYDAQNEILKKIYGYLELRPEDGIMILPLHLADAAAYLIGKKVLWGTHGTDGTGRWAKIEELFPVIKKPIEYFFEKYSLHFLLIDKNFVEPEDLKLGPEFKKILEKDNYFLFEYQK